MDNKPIQSDEEYKAVMARIDAIWAAELGTKEAEELTALAILVEKYESDRYMKKAGPR